MSKIKIILNDKEVFVEAGKTILEAARENGIDDIPTLCHDKHLAPFGSCFVCVVEVEGARGLLPSCATKVREGMQIKTKSDKIIAARKTAFELLMSNHYADCVAPCAEECPANVDVQGYIALVNLGKYKEAIELIKEKNPLPAVCGRVCTRPCEIACRRNLVDEPVGIDFLKRFASDKDMFSDDMYLPEQKEKKNDKIAIIGAGPAGVSCSYYLCKEGYSPTLFEAMDKPGGMLRWGIPEYRLPRDVLDKEIAAATTDLGAKILYNKELGKNVSLSSLKKEGYKAIYLAVGAQNPSPMRIRGENSTENVFGGIDFLRNNEKYGKKPLSGRVAVIGGGNTAIDCARTSLRLGAEEVVIVYRRTKKEMPANDMEIHEAEKEGIKFLFLNNPVGLVAENGRLKALTCVKMELGEPDASGRRRPIPIEGSEFDYECSYAFAAIGQTPDINFLRGYDDIQFFEEKGELETTRWKTIEADPNTFETNVEGVFTGGDVYTGAATAIEAIAAGRKAAKSIMHYLNGEEIVPEKRDFVSKKDTFKDVKKEDIVFGEESKKNNMPELQVGDRMNFDEVELGYTDEQACNESARCLECGCTEAFTCVLRKYATDYDIDIEKYKGAVNAYEVDKSHPFIVIDNNKCVLCGRCIRTCDEIIGSSALGFINRGFGTAMRPALDKPLLETNCVMCGNCINACPTAALAENMPVSKPGPWELHQQKTICQYCSVGCTVDYNMKGDKFVFASPAEDGCCTKTVNDGYLCNKGKFGNGYINACDRITAPMIGKDGAFVEASWEEAGKVFGDKVKAFIDKNGKDALGVFVSPRMTNEELFAAQKFARDVLGTNNIDSFSRLLRSPKDFGQMVSNRTFGDLDKADAIVLVNSDITEEHFVLGLKIRKAIKAGRKVVVVDTKETRITDACPHSIIVKEDKIAELMEFVRDTVKKDTEGSIWEDKAKYFGVAKDDLKRLHLAVCGCNDGLVIYNTQSVPGACKLNNAMESLFAQCKDLGRIILREKANSQGLLDMGAVPMHKPGYQDVKADFEDMVLQINNGKIKGAIIFGEDITGYGEYLDKCELLVVIDSNKTASVEKADVVFPMAVSGELSGTYTNAERRLQKLSATMPILSEKNNVEVISLLADALGKELGLSSDYCEILGEIKKDVPFYNVEKGNILSEQPIFDKGEVKTNCLAGKVIADSLERRFAEIKNNLKK